MQITRNSLDTTPGPADWFTGTVYIDTMASPSEPSRVGAASVHFTPGARTAWHTHPLGQTIHVTEGVALCQRRGGPIEVIGPGDSVFFEPGEEHWHGAAPNRVMTHIAGGDEVVMSVHLYGRGKGSGVRGEWHNWQVCTVREGKIVRRE